MNFMGNSSGGGRRQHQALAAGGGGGGGGGGGYSYEEDADIDEEVKEQVPAAGQLFSSSPSTSHPPPPYHQHHRGGWLLNTSQGGESSSSSSRMMLSDSANPQLVEHGRQDEVGEGGGGGGGGGGMMMVEREHMFDKVVTPSDVGKLNRLVIPKQHAERYFPLDSSTNDKGLLLNFEDRNGKPWRFRYSYWNSSQSYVMTKGWSRFVKEKKLDAGDIVSFQRGVGGSAKDRLFIDWRRRPDAPTHAQLPHHFSFPQLQAPHHQFSSFHTRNAASILHPGPPTASGSVSAWNPLFLQSQPRSTRMLHPNAFPTSYSYTYAGGAGPGPGPYNISTGSVVNVNQGSLIYFRSGGGGGGTAGGGAPQQQQQQPQAQEAAEMMQSLHQRSGGTGTGIGIGIGIDPVTSGAGAGAGTAGVVFESVPVVHGKAAAKRLRLFGVNMDCPISEEDHYDPSSHQELSTSSAHAHPSYSHHQNFPPPSTSSTIPYHQLTPFYGSARPTPSNQTSSPDPDPDADADAFNKNKSTSSNMSLDFDI